MTKKELTNRWNTKEGKLLLDKIFNCLTKGITLSSVDGVKKHKGRWDLRGAVLSLIEKKQKIEADGHAFIKKTGSLKVGETELNSIDFSFANISYSVFEKTVIKDCIFEETIAKEMRFIACEINGCIFKKANLSYSYLNQNIGENSGSFINTKFIETNLKECIFYFPIIKDCDFFDCNLMATNFDGSRMQYCKFAGKVDSPLFNGYSLNAHKSILGIFNRVNPKQYPNLMEDIDFSAAVLIGVAFRNGINLSSCKFPKDGNCLVVNNIEYTFLMAKEYICNNWDGDDKRIALHMIENVYYTKDYYSQDMTVIDKYILLDQFGERFANRFFELIQTFQ